ncbi:hypothetical protein [Micromonospora sp. RTGN7]|uniref:hypothetical protein n=1 Tax=Micromonospora sp. RTGN7 TaxID=3016526 RepID=UPI0029FED470|nr:hypothetical protein [Micromonospora sp. RTGN7]
MVKYSGESDARSVIAQSFVEGLPGGWFVVKDDQWQIAGGADRTAAVTVAIKRHILTGLA